MPEVRLFLASESINSWDCAKLVDEATQWETVTDEELGWLRERLYTLPRPDHNLHYILVVKDDVCASRKLESIRAIIDKEKKAEEERKEKNRIANQKRQATAKANKEKKEREQLAKLQKKYNNG
jgi:hypothetical protein